MKRVYGVQIDLIDILYGLVFGAACWLEKKRKAALKRFEGCNR